MTQTQSKAEEVADRLLGIGGVIACVVRAHTAAPRTPTEIRQDAERTAMGMLDPEAKAQFVQGFVDGAERDVRDYLSAEPPPFPHVVRGNADIVHYLRGMTNLLAPGIDHRIDAKVGEIRMIAESWTTLIVAVGLQADDRANKSLARALRGVRKRG